MEEISINIEDAKSICEDIGFVKGTEKFGECVLELYKGEKSNKTISRSEQESKSSRTG